MRVGEAEMFLQRSIFLSSSMAEHSAVNRVVVGSSPTWGAEASLQVVTALFFIFATAHYEAENHRFLPDPCQLPRCEDKTYRPCVYARSISV